MNQHPIDDDRPGGYPLSALFVLIAMTGVLMGLVSSVPKLVQDGDVGAGEVIVSCIVGAIALMIVGSIVGVNQHHSFRGAIIGSLLGIVLGILAGPLFLVRDAGFSQLMFVSLGGSIVLVVIGALSRLKSRNSEVVIPAESDDADSPMADNKKSSDKPEKQRGTV